MHKILFSTLAACLFISFYYTARGTDPLTASPDSIVILKQKHEMCLYKQRQLQKVYKIALGLQPTGPKQYEGDMRTPEGLYFVKIRNEHSLYHKSLGISYPAAKDIINAKKLGKRPGGDIMIHGLPNGKGYIGSLHRLKDWTHGCIALTDEEIDELFSHVAVGTPVNILP